MSAEYTRVPLTLSESSDDELYVKDISKYGDLELKLIPPSNGKNPVPQNEKKRKSKAQRTANFLSCRQIVCLVLTIFFTFLFVSMLILVIVNSLPKLIDGLPPKSNTSTESTLSPTSTVLPVHSSATTTEVTKSGSTDWEFQMNGTSPESIVRLVDVDGDGLKDIIFGTYTNMDIAMSYDGKIPVKQFCKQNQLEFPCFGLLYALRGYDGEVLWKVKTIGNSLIINCIDFDVNKDGLKDCIVTGRVGMVQAVEMRTGKTLWYGDTKWIKSAWNIYQVLALPDFDEDGVPEMLVINGGDPVKDPEDHNRESGRMMILSGATGKTVGKHFLAMPDSKESYTSAVMYNCPDGSKYILFGSGGETVPGNFMMIALPDLYSYVMNESSATGPALEGKYDQWSNLKKDPVTKIITLYRGQKKGVSVPPVIVDVNNDKVDDILLSAYEGKVILYNGKNLSIIWEVDFPGHESYSSPAPGHFDDDDIVDFMMHWSEGSWPSYSNSKIVVLSGKNGDILWCLETPMFEMSSDLSLRTDQKNRDVFIFRVTGRGAASYTFANGTVVHHSLPHQPNHLRRQVYKRHGGGPGAHVVHNEPVGGEPDVASLKKQYAKKHLLCEDDLNINSEIFLMDRTILDQPIRIAIKKSTKYTYVTRKHFSDKESTNQTMCIVLLAEDRTTGAVADLDGDGELDLVYIYGLVGEKIDSFYSYQEMQYFGFVNKISLQPKINDRSTQTKINAKSDMKIGAYDLEPRIGDIRLLPMDQQVWTEYMGKSGNSRY